MNQKWKQILGFVIGVLLLSFLDQWTKKLVVSVLKGNPPFVIWEGVFEFFYSENRGAAFGMLQGKQGFFFLVAIVVFAVVIYALWRMPAARRYLPMEICLTMIASGALGNLIDRVAQGYVVDFLYFKLIDFPIFNVADCYVTVGTFCLVVLLMWFYSDKELEFFYFRKKEKM